MSALRTLPVAAAALIVALAFAQDAEEPTATVVEAPAEPAAAPAPAPAKDVKPRAAEMAPLASRSLLLAAARAGDRVITVGDRGVILATTDGAKWEQMAAPVHTMLTAVSFGDASSGWVGGHDAVLLHTVDGGRSWKLQHFAPALNKPVLSILALDAQRAYAVGAYGLFLATSDAGATWTPVDAPEILEDGLHLNSLIRLGNGALFVAGETGLAGVSADGVKWQRLTVPYEGSLFGALPRGEKGALVFGLRGNVLYSDDVAANKWTRVETGTVQSMFGGTVLADGKALLVGADDALLLVQPDGSARSLGHPGGASGTLSAVLPWQDQFLLAGEQGVRLVRLSGL